MIKNIVFDMGNVLRVFDKDLFLDRVGATGEDRTLLKNEVFLSLDWARMDRGSRTDETALLGMLENLPKRLHSVAAKLVLEWDKNVDPMPGMEGLIRDLKKRGYCIYLLSNASYRAHEYWLNTPGHEYFDGALFSCDVKMIKPDICI